MTPKEKAIKLMHKFYDKFYRDDDSSWEHAKDCALICVDESIEELTSCKDFYPTNSYYDLRIVFLNKVKQEIEKL